MAMMDAQSRSVVTPATQLATAADAYTCGMNTYQLANNNIYAATTGVTHIEAVAATATTAATSSISVLPRKATLMLPAVGSYVTCRVHRVTARDARCEILMIHVPTPATAENLYATESTIVLPTPLTGQLRQRDVRRHDIDNVVMINCFRPTDIIRARVIALGDTRSYFLSTVGNECGVLLAYSAVGVAMLPVSWELMQCPVTAVKQQRKVAKPATAITTAAAAATVTEADIIAEQLEDAVMV